VFEVPEPAIASIFPPGTGSSAEAGGDVSSGKFVNNIKTDPGLAKLAKIRRTEIARVTFYVIGCIALAVLGVALSLGMIAAVVFLFLCLGGVMVLPTFAVVTLIVASSTALVIGLTCLTIAGFAFTPSMGFGNCGGEAAGMAIIAILLLIVIIGAVSPAIAGIWFLCHICENLSFPENDIEKKRIKELVVKMQSDLLLRDPDAYVIACLSLAEGLDIEIIQNLCWNQINLEEKLIELTYASDRKVWFHMKYNHRPPLDLYEKFKENGESVIFPKERFRKSYCRFIKWMKDNGFGGDARLAVCHIVAEQGEIHSIRKFVNFSEINLPEEYNKEGEINLSELFYCANRGLQAQNLCAYFTFFLIFNYGLKEEEIRKLNWSMIDLDQKRITIPATPGGKEKIICLNSMHCDLLLRQKRNCRGENSMLFDGNKLKKSLSALCEFLKMHGVTKEFKTTIVRKCELSASTSPDENAGAVDENVELDLSFFESNFS
jgi:hypothetical protein